MSNIPDLEALRQGFVNAIPHVRACGMQIEELERGRSLVRLPYREDWLGDRERGLIATGIITTLVDSAAGVAAFSALDEVEPIATLDLRMDYLRPSHPPHDLWCEARCERLTRNIAFLRASVWQQQRDEPVASGQGAFMRGTTRSRAHSE